MASILNKFFGPVFTSERQYDTLSSWPNANISSYLMNIIVTNREVA